MDISEMTPLYKQLKQTLTDKIKNGDWPTGTKIPTEEELCDQYEVSRITVRQALGEMSNEGIVVRKQGRGTFVAPPKVSTKLSSFYSFSSELQKQGFQQHDKILCFERMDADPKVAQRLGVVKFCPVFVVERLRFINRDPFVYETSYIPIHLCPRLTKEAIEECGLYESLRKIGGIEPDSAEEEFEASTLPAQVSSLLQMPRSSPILLIERVARMDQNVFEYCRSYLRSDRYKFTIYMKK